jgi:secreted trypsin-like serine protease
MSEDKAISGPLWATVVGALVAAIMVVAAFFVFVQSGEAAPHTADKQSPYASASPKIIDGKAVPNGKYPFMAYVKLYRNGKFYGSCAGSLIDQDSVLTAAHCLINTTGAVVVVGRTDLRKKNQGQVIGASRPFIHPRYNPKTDEYDAGVLKLLRPVKGIKPVKLASSRQNYLEKPGRKATVAGWGSMTAQPRCRPPQWPTPSPVVSKHLRLAQVPILSDAKAEQVFKDVCRFIGPSDPNYTPRLMVAAGGTGKDACQGDSGGPLFVARASDGDGKNGASSVRYIQIGITSFGLGCGVEPLPGVYTEVNNPSIRSFIKSAASK